MIRTAWADSPLGRILLAGTEDALTGLWFEGQAHFAANLPADAEAAEQPVFAAARAWLDAYFAGRDPKEPPRLAPAGTPFRQAVWRILRTIPRGATISYGQIARRLTAETGRPASARAVGGAVGHNPVSLMIPCHRVTGSDGSLTGYAGGLDRKLFLLRLEGAVRD